MSNSPMSDDAPPPEGGGQDCLFCTPTLIGGVWQHTEDCPARTMAQEKERLRRAAQRQAQQSQQVRPDKTSNSSERARLRESMRSTSDAAQRALRGDWPLTEGQKQQLREAGKPSEQERLAREAELQALAQAKAEAEARAQTQADHERLAREQQARYDLDAKRLLGETDAEQAERKALAGEPLPEWIQALLRERGVPDAVFQEFRGGPLLPNLDHIATPPAQAAPLPAPKLEIPAEVEALRAGLKALRVFFTDVDDNVTQSMLNIEASIRDQYINAGAIYGPSEEGLWVWAGEMAETMRCTVRLQRIERNHEARRRVNTYFPSFWQGEWEVASTPLDQQEQTYDPALPKQAAPPTEDNGEAGHVSATEEAATTPASDAPPLFPVEENLDWMED